MGLFDIFKKQARPLSDLELPRTHHYTFAYKALPGLAFADPHGPLGLASVTYSWKEFEKLLASGDPFEGEMPNRKLAEFWAYAGAKLPRHEILSDSGLSAIGGEFGADNTLVLIRMPEPVGDTEAYFVALVYPKSWLDDPKVYENSKPDLRCYLLAKSKVPGGEGISGATLRVVKRAGHGAVSFGVHISTRAFLEEVQASLAKPERWITWVENPTWNFLMCDSEAGQIHGAV